MPGRFSSSFVRKENVPPLSSHLVANIGDTRRDFPYYVHALALMKDGSSPTLFLFSGFFFPDQDERRPSQRAPLLWLAEDPLLFLSY